MRFHPGRLRRLISVCVLVVATFGLVASPASAACPTAAGIARVRALG